MYYAIAASDPVLSPWVTAPFVLKGVSFHSLGQAVEYFRAEYFGDSNAAQEILRTRNPKDCGAIGAHVGVKDDTGWIDMLRKILWHCTKERTLQNCQQVAALLFTGTLPIAFCAKGDLGWGAGVGVGDSALARSEELPGANWLGKALTHVRDTLLEPLTPLADECALRDASNRERAVLLGLTLYYLEKATGIWGRQFEIGDVALGLRGKAAGMALYPSFDIKYNERLFLENSQEFVNDVVPHEVAHIIVYQLYGPKTPGHGKEWKSVMKALGKIPSTYHQFSTINTGIHAGKRIVASCGHRIYLLSPTLARETRHCNECRRPLRNLWPEMELRKAIEDQRKQIVSELDI